jgi:hypothetical protein
VSQCEDIKAHLQAGYSLTALEALQRFQCFRLAARIADLKKEGMHIDAVMVADEDTGKVYARYSTPTFRLEFSP